MALNRYTVEALRSGERARLTCWRLRLGNREVFLVALICEQPHLRCLGQGAKRCTLGRALPSIFAFILVLVGHAHAPESSGSGPLASVPVQTATIAPFTLPPRTRI